MDHEAFVEWFNDEDIHISDCSIDPDDTENYYVKYGKNYSDTEVEGKTVSNVAMIVLWVLFSVFSCILCIVISFTNQDSHYR